MKTKMIAVFALVMASMFVTAPAMAEEPPAEETTQVVAPPVEPEAAPEAAPEAQTQPEVVTKTKPPKDDEETDHKELVCHPVNGKGKLGNGWNLIPPDKHSSHIDDEGNPKHESHDGRVDIISVDGTCPDPDPGPQPETDVEKREIPGAPDCEAGTVTALKQERTRIYTLVDFEWVPGQWSPWTTVEEIVEEVTSEQCPPPPHDECPLIDGNQPEGYDCDPVVEEPPTEEPPVTEEPPTVEPPAALPDTGAQENLMAMLAAGLAALVLGGGAVVASRVRK